MRKLLVLLALVAAVGCASGPKTKYGEVREEEEIPLVGTFKVNRYTLANGLRLLVVEDHSAPTLAYQTWFRVGSRDEVPGRTGLAHLFEHMMFKQTKNLKEGEFDRTLESAGAEGLNAFTSRDYTAYVQEMPSDKLELIARLEAERMVNLVINEKAFKTETEVVQNERRMRYENSPDGMMYQEVFANAYDKHPYHWPVIGYEQDLASMSAKYGEEFYKAYYSPNHATIVVVGDVDPMKTLRLVQKYYGDIPSQASPTKVIESDPERTAPRRKQLKLNMQIEKIQIGYRIPPTTHGDTPALGVLQAILNGGNSSRLNRALVETGIASSVYAYGNDGKDPSLFIVGANLQSKKKAAQAESVVLRELDKLRKEPVSEQEIQRAKNLIEFGFYEAQSTNDDKANFLGRYEALAGNFQAGLSEFRKVKDVTPADVQSVVNKYFAAQSRTVITGVPK